MLFTQHHLIQFERAISHFKIEKSSIVIIVFKYSINNDSYKWVQVLKNSGEYYSVNVYKFIRPRQLLFNRTELKKYIVDLKSFSSFKPTRLFTSHLYVSESKLAHYYLKPQQYFVLDEGSASFGIIKKRNKKAKLSVKSFLLSVLYCFRLHNPKKITYFTQYNLPILNSYDDKVIYKFETINNKLSIDDNSVILLGSNMYEDNILIGIEYYFTYLKLIIKKYKNKDLYYYAHRQETTVSLEKISLLGFVVKKNNEPFEFLFPNLNPCPKTILSFGSPILDTITKKYLNLPELIIIKPAPNLLSNEVKDQYNLMYDAFENNKHLKIWNIYE